jgi:hypothetical protein
MRVMVFGKAIEDNEKGAPPSPEAFAAMDRFTEELAKAGVLVVDEIADATFCPGRATGRGAF